jgi:sugar lactone lactonase YvrE
MKKNMLLLLFILLSHFSSSQIITTYAGCGEMGYLGDGGPATNAELGNGPLGIAFDKNGDLLICHHDYVRKVNSISGIISTAAGDTTATLIGDGGLATNALIDEPYNICIDAYGNLYISDYHASEIRKVDILTGIITSYVGTGISGNSGDGGLATNATLGSPYGVCIDTMLKYLYLSDEYNNRVRKVDMITGIITDFAGTGTYGYSGDNGPAINAKLSHTLGLALDHSGNLYIGEWGNGTIRKVDAVTGIITTFAGIGVEGYGGRRWRASY